MKVIFDYWFLPLSACLGIIVIATNMFSFLRAIKVKVMLLTGQDMLAPLLVSRKWFLHRVLWFLPLLYRHLFGWTGCCIIGWTLLMQLLEVIIARLDHHGDYK